MEAYWIVRTSHSLSHSCLFVVSLYLPSVLCCTIASCASIFYFPSSALLLPPLQPVFNVLPLVNSARATLLSLLHVLLLPVIIVPLVQRLLMELHAQRTQYVQEELHNHNSVQPLVETTVQWGRSLQSYRVLSDPSVHASINLERIKFKFISVLLLILTSLLLLYVFFSLL